MSRILRLLLLLLLPLRFLLLLRTSRRRSSLPGRWLGRFCSKARAATWRRWTWWLIIVQIRRFFPRNVFAGYECGLQAAQGDQLCSAARKTDAIASWSSRCNPIGALIRRCERRLDAAASDEDVGSCFQIIGNEDARSTVGRSLSGLETGNFQS